jgi:hypothetical protein
MSWLHKILPSKLFREVVLPSPGYLKVGKWVMAGDRVAIVTSIASYPQIDLMFVDEKGENLFAATSGVGSLRLAVFEEIPVPRRPSREVANARGYRSAQ